MRRRHAAKPVGAAAHIRKGARTAPTRISKPSVIEVPPLVAVHASYAPAVRLTPLARRVPRALRPVPMTAAERALMRFAESNPALIEQVLVEAPKQMALDLSIEPITIEPLSTGGE